MATYLKKAIELVDRQIEFTEKQIFEEQRVFQCQYSSKVKKRQTLKWTGKIVDFVEIIYALKASGSIAHGNITLTEMFQILGEVFEIDIKDFSGKFMDIKIVQKATVHRFWIV